MPGRYISALILACTLACVLAAPIEASGQFKDDVYLPRLGDPQEIDSLYGDGDWQRLGLFLDIVPNVDEPSKPLVAISKGDFWSSDDAEVKLYEPKEIGRLRDFESVGDLSFLFPGKIQSIRFNGRNGTDLLATTLWGIRRIYWRGSDGQFDSSRYTELVLPWTTEAGISYSAFEAIVGPFGRNAETSILLPAAPAREGGVKDSVYLILFDGDDLVISQPKVAHPSSLHFWRMQENTGRHGGYPTCGDFNGDGYWDIIYHSKHSTFATGYFGKPNFVLSDFGNSLLFDTLIVARSSYFLETIVGIDEKGSLAAKSYLSPGFDDLVMSVLEDTPDTRAVYVFQGHPEFGKSQLGMPDITIPEPRPNSYWGQNVWNVGDMSGTGTDVVLVQSSQGPFETGYYYYDLWALEPDSIVMYYDFDDNGSNSKIDTADINNDGRTDHFIAHPSYTSEMDALADKEGVGTIHLVYGSAKIRSTQGVQTPSYHREVRVWPNVLSSGSQINIDAQLSPSARLRVIDLLGRMAGEIQLNGAKASLPHLTSGTYLLVIEDNLLLSRVIPIQIE